MQTTVMQAGEVSLAKWTKQIKRSALQEMLAAASRPGILSFALGLPAPEFFPAEAYAQAAAQVLANEPRALQYGPPLQVPKTHIVRLMAERGVRCSESQVLLTAGAQQGMNLLSRLLLEPGDQVIIEQKCYPGFRQVLDPFEPDILAVPTDMDTGMDVQAVESLLERGAQPSLVYAIPEGQNPLAVSMNAVKREQLVELARQWQVPIIEDDAYGFLNYNREVAKPMRALGADWVFYVGSFSKIMAPALRVGWLVVPEQFMAKLSIVKEASDIDTATFTQRIISAYLDTGELPAHLAFLRSKYQLRRDTMLDALEKHFPRAAQWRTPASGVFIWVELPDEIDTTELLRLAIETAKVAFIPGSAFCVGGGNREMNSMRLNFSNCKPDDITEGIQRLARVIQR
ncbi:MAG: PLP-dependent aminotransferase family protein [Blastocatellia bacterium]